MQSLAFDLLFLAGLACIVGGLWWMWPPLGLLALGGACVSVGWLGAQAWVRNRRGRR